MATAAFTEESMLLGQVGTVVSRVIKNAWGWKHAYVNAMTVNIIAATTSGHVRFVRYT
jgi:hypothetical protein